MFFNKRGDTISWIILIGIVILLLQASLNGGGFIFFIGLSIVCVYIGRKKLPAKSGKLLLGFGLLSLFINIINLLVFKFIITALLIYTVYYFFQSKKTPKVIQPILQEPLDSKGVLHKRMPLLKNMWYGRQQTSDHVYEWNDISIQCGIGDTVIDLSQTILPQGEAVIFIRNFVGNVYIHLPYETEMSLHHSVLAGSITLFETEEPRVYNQVIHYETADFRSAAQKVKIMTSMVAGHFEVKRI